MLVCLCTAYIKLFAWNSLLLLVFLRTHLIPRPGLEVARTRATRVRTAAAIVSSQVILLELPIEVEWCLTCRLLHRKREVALRIHRSLERIVSLRRRPGYIRAAQDSIPPGLPYKQREGYCLLCYLIKQRSVIRASDIEAVLRLWGRGDSHSWSMCWRLYRLHGGSSSLRLSQGVHAGLMVAVNVYGTGK